MVEVQKRPKDFQIPSQPTFYEAVAVLRAVRFLGMEPYAKVLMKEVLAHLKNKDNLLLYEEITLVESMATSDKDPLYTSLVNNLSQQRFRGVIPDLEEFAGYLKHHPKLSASLDKADKYFAHRAKTKALVPRQAHSIAQEDKKKGHTKDQRKLRQGKHNTVASLRISSTGSPI